MEQNLNFSQVLFIKNIYFEDIVDLNELVSKQMNNICCDNLYLQKIADLITIHFFLPYLSLRIPLKERLNMSKLET